MTDLPVHPHRGKPLAVRLLRALVGWNAGALLYLLLALKMMFWSSHEQMRRRALVHDEGNTIVLVLVVLAAVF
jgi:uncharacterized membrane protein